MKINKAVIPVAGLGTRMLPASSTVSKCLFPVVDKPVVHYVVDEAIDSGIEEIVLVLGSNRDAIQQYFTDTTRKHVQDFQKKCDFRFVVQENPDGLGSAIKCARDLVGQSDFAVLLGDAILRAQQPVISQLMQHVDFGVGAVIGVEQVARDAVQRYGIIDGDQITDRLLSVRNLVEKPAMADAPSNLAIAARYLLNSSIFDALENTSPDQKGEVQLTHALQTLLAQQSILAWQFEGKRFDIGNKLDFIRTNIALGLEDPEYGEELASWMQSILSLQD